jgi:hypothetical protein
MKSTRKNRGQFIIIAVLLAALMIVSIGALMHSAITFYRHEPWEEYATQIGDVEINSAKLVELSLASYTNGPSNSTILNDNLEKWQSDLLQIYPSSGVILKSVIYGMTQGLNPSARVDFTLNINSIGLTGYKFSARSALRVDIIRVYSPDSVSYEITAVIKDESGQPIPNLKTSNFRINNTSPTAVSSFYDTTYVLEYVIEYQGSLPATLEVTDNRGIRAVGIVTQGY